MRRFLVVLCFAAVCGLSVYVGGWITLRLFLLVFDRLVETAPPDMLWRFIGFVPGALLGAAAARWMIRRYYARFERTLLGGRPKDGAARR